MRQPQSQSQGWRICDTQRRFGVRCIDTWKWSGIEVLWNFLLTLVQSDHYSNRLFNIVFYTSEMNTASMLNADKNYFFLCKKKLNCSRNSNLLYRQLMTQQEHQLKRVIMLLNLKGNFSRIYEKVCCREYGVNKWPGEGPHSIQ